MQSHFATVFSFFGHWDLDWLGNSYKLYQGSTSLQSAGHHQGNILRRNKKEGGGRERERERERERGRKFLHV